MFRRALTLACLVLTLSLLPTTRAEAYWTFLFDGYGCTGEANYPWGMPDCEANYAGITATTVESGRDCLATVYCADGITVKSCYAYEFLGEWPAICGAWVENNGHVNCKSDYGLYSGWCVMT